MPSMTDDAGAFGFSDAARRVADIVRQAIGDGHRNKWMAFAMSDGRNDGDPGPVRIYDTKMEAVRYTRNRYSQYMYLVVPWDDLTPRGAEVFLKIHRQLAKNGQHPLDDDLAKTTIMTDSRLEAYPSLDPRRRIATQWDRSGAPVRRSPGGVILP